MRKNKRNFLHAKMYYFNDSTPAPTKALQYYINKRAYYLWKEQGMPEGKDKQIWTQAELDCKDMISKGVIMVSPEKNSVTKNIPKKNKDRSQDRIANLEEAFLHISNRLEQLEKTNEQPEFITKQTISESSESEPEKNNNIEINCLEQEKIL